MTLEQRVGLTVSFLLILFVIGVFLTKDFSIRRNRYHYEVEFQGVTNVRAGDPVSVLGVQMGKVTDVRIEDNKVVVKFYTEKYKLRVDSRVILESIGLLGQSKIQIVPGEGKFAPERYTFQGEKGRGFDDLIDRFLYLTDSLVVFINDFRSLSKDFAPLLSKLEKNLDDLGKSASVLKDSLSVMISKQDSNLTRTLENFNKTLSDIDSLSLSLKNSPLLTDSSFYSKLDSSLTSLRDLAESLKEGINVRLKLGKGTK